MPNIIEIADFHAPELDPYARLTQNQLRNRLEPEKGIFIAESPKVIDRALDAGYEPVSLLMERRQITGPAAGILSRCGDAPVYSSITAEQLRADHYDSVASKWNGKFIYWFFWTSDKPECLEYDSK